MESTKYCYDYPHPAVASDCAVVAKENGQWQILLIERKHDPYKGKWAIPGGFMEIDETTEAAAIRELQEETGIEVTEVEQVYTFSDVHRDPRERVITVLYLTLVDKAEHNPVANDDAQEIKWFYINDLPPLAFDHNIGVAKVVEKLNAL